MKRGRSTDLQSGYYKRKGRRRMQKRGLVYKVGKNDIEYRFYLYRVAEHLILNGAKLKLS